VSRIVSECHARFYRTQTISALPGRQLSSDCRIALIGLDSPPSNGDSALNLITALKEAGLKVVTYGDGAHSWSLATQCLPLLAGSVKLLDSAKSEFVTELQQLIEQLLRTEALTQGENEKLKMRMKELGIVGESQAIIAIFRWIAQVSVLSDLPVLITGETGTGKQILANAIYRLDPKRRDGPFIAVNCAAISPALAESELFGHRRGAFTGADRDRMGLIRSAHEGILFLDEIGELDLELQSKLLRTLQEKRVLGIGEDRESDVDVRVIAATNQNLDTMVRERRFRLDLFHRLNVLCIHVPPLRERRADIEPLTRYFLDHYGPLNPKAKFAREDFYQALMELTLPGNVRQLENLVRQAVIGKNDYGPLNLSDLPLDVWRELSASPRSSPQTVLRIDLENRASTTSGPNLETREFSSEPRERNQSAELAATALRLLKANGWSLSRSMEHCEKLFLQAALTEAHGNQTRTARLLGITPRSVYNKHRKHNLPS
jgi:transcriptional regulator with PAS, ATPase and Fis domain